MFSTVARKMAPRLPLAGSRTFCSTSSLQSSPSTTPFDPQYDPLGPKTSTGLVGLPVHPHPLPALMKQNEELSVALSKLPNCPYRTNVEAVIAYRSGIAAKALEMVEKKERTMDQVVAWAENEIGGTRKHLQIEEMIEEAQDEMEVAAVYLEERLWEREEDDL